MTNAPTTDGRYEALVVFYVLECHCMWDVNGNRNIFDIPELDVALADLHVVGKMKSLRYEIETDYSVSKHTESASAIRQDADARLVANRAELERLTIKHPNLAKALETRYRKQRLRNLREDLAGQARRITGAEGILAEAQEIKKRKRVEYVELCREIGREPTPEPAPAADQ